MMTGKIPYSNIKSDYKVIATVLGGNKTPEPDPEPNWARLLNLMLDPLLRECWKFEADERPDALSCQRMLDHVISNAYPFSSFRFQETSTVGSEVGVRCLGYRYRATLFIWCIDIPIFRTRSPQVYVLDQPPCPFSLSRHHL